MTAKTEQDGGNSTGPVTGSLGDTSCLPTLTRRTVIRAAGAAALLSANVKVLAGPEDALAAERAAGRMGPHAIKEIETAWVEMPDGVKIALRILMPEDAEVNPVPAIMEYIPYRRRDLHRIADDTHFFYLASSGYACIRPDIRGSGDSEGVLKDEYLQSEQDDGVAIIAWIAKQPWCTGSVGMMGISWGGFSALQVAARRPPALKAIITHCSTDDRYTDDAHYIGGAILDGMFGWGSTFFTLQAFPPDPAVVGTRWRDIWKARCDGMDFSIASWVEHQSRDVFWKHASVNENYGDIVCPVYAIGGWADGYTNSIPRLMEHLAVPRKALIGPWGHSYPHRGEPGPKIDYLNDSLRWWDHWLKGKNTGIMDEPMYRVWMQDDVAHSPTSDVAGRWVAEESWPSPRITSQIWYVNDRSLDVEGHPAASLNLAPPHQTVGTAAGSWCPAGGGVQAQLAVQLPLDQQQDDGRSLVFDSAPLRERIEILGSPTVELDLAVDKPVALLSVCLNEVHPGGTSRKMTYGVLNLTHRDGHEAPKPLEPGKRYRVRVELKHAGFAFKPGHRIRVTIASACWPLVWPSPEPVTLSVFTGASTLSLPVRPTRPQDGALQPFGPAFVPPTSGMTQIKPAALPTKEFSWDVGNSMLTITNKYDSGVTRIDAVGTMVSSRSEDVSRICDLDPASAQLRSWRSQEFVRKDWNVRIETTVDVSCTKENYILKGDVKTFDHGKPFFTRSWTRTIARQLS
jgi:putative CocE/NonD family hydrolase